MKNPKTVYVLLESYIRNGLIIIRKELELNNHDTKAILAFNHLKNNHELMLQFLEDNPSVDARVLRDLINALYKRDKTAHGVRLTILYREDYDLGKVSNETLIMY